MVDDRYNLFSHESCPAGYCHSYDDGGGGGQVFFVVFLTAGKWKRKLCIFM